MIVLDLEVFSQWTEDVVGLFESFWRGYADHVLAISESFRTPQKPCYSILGRANLPEFLIQVGFEEVHRIDRYCRERFLIK